MRTEVCPAPPEELLETDGFNPANLAERDPEVGLHEMLRISGQDVAERQRVIEIAGADDPEGGGDGGAAAPPLTRSGKVEERVLAS